MKKNSKLLLLVIAILISVVVAVLFLLRPGGALSRSEAGHAFSYFKNMNQFEVIISKELDRDRVEIFWNDDVLFKQGSINRKTIENQRYIYGVNTFRIKYDFKFIGEFKEYKSNNWNYNKYKFYFKLKDQQVISNLEINGLKSDVNWGGF